MKKISLSYLLPGVVLLGIIGFVVFSSINGSLLKGCVGCPVASLNWKWAQAVGYPSATQLVGVGVSNTYDANGNLYVTGYYKNAAWFGTTAAGQIVTSLGVDLFIAKYGTDKKLLWVRSSKVASKSAALARDIAIDTFGNVYVTGTFNGTVTFGAIGQNQASLSSSANFYIFIAKYDQNGNFLWARQAGTALGLGNNDAGNAISVTKGFVYMSGTFWQTASFGPPGNVQTITSLGASNGFLAKYDQNGNLIWVQRAAGGGSSPDAFVATDGNNDNSYITGNYNQSVTVGSGQNPVALTSSPGNYSGFMAKFGPNGNVLWAKNVASNDQNTSSSFGRDITVDKNNNIYIAGDLHGSVTFAIGVTLQSTNLYIPEPFISKYDPNGIFLWVRTGKATGGSVYAVSSIATDTSNVYLAGVLSTAPGENAKFSDPSGNSFTPSSSNTAGMYIVKYDKNGTLVAGGSVAPPGPIAQSNFYCQSPSACRISASQYGEVAVSAAFLGILPLGSVSVSSVPIDQDNIFIGALQ